MTFARPRARAVTASVMVAALGIIASACSSGSANEPSVVAAAPTTTGSTTVTSSVPTEVPSTVAAAIGLPDQEDAALRLYDAWFADDRATAAAVADPTAIEAMWMTQRGDYSLYNRCSTGEFDTSGCLFRGANGTIQIDLEKRGDNWVVAGAFYSEP